MHLQWNKLFKMRAVLFTNHYGIAGPALSSDIQSYILSPIQQCRNIINTKLEKLGTEYPGFPTMTQHKGSSELLIWTVRYYHIISLWSGSENQLHA